MLATFSVRSLREWYPSLIAHLATFTDFEVLRLLAVFRRRFFLA